MKKMITIYAAEGKILTNGETYGTTISLAEGLDESGFYEITQEEYENILGENVHSIDAVPTESEEVQM